jgi:hypothetical protein
LFDRNGYKYDLAYTNMTNDKLFTATISYLKIVTVAGILLCILSLFTKSFDPMGADGLEGMIMTDLYGVKNMPAAAKPAFEFAFLLFVLLSILTLAGQWLVIQHGLAKKQKWAYHYMILVGICWPIGACAIAMYTGAYSYLVSAGMMTVLFTSPTIVLYKYFR